MGMPIVTGSGPGFITKSSRNTSNIYKYSIFVLFLAISTNVLQIKRLLDVSVVGA